MLGGQRYELLLPAGEERVGGDEDRVDSRLGQRGENGINLV